MREVFNQHEFDDDHEGLIFVDGTRLEIDSIESAIDALARDEALQADLARRRGGPELREGPR